MSVAKDRLQKWTGWIFACFIIFAIYSYQKDVTKLSVLKETKHRKEITEHRNDAKSNDEGSKSKYEWQLAKYREAFLSKKYSSKNNKINKIAVAVFGKENPAKRLRNSHVYPFLTGNSLRSWLDWSYDILNDCLLYTSDAADE